jgi:hypothetical protein
VAEVQFDNVDVNSNQHDGTYPLSIPIISAEVTFTWDAAGGADMIAVIVPEGYIADPPSLTIPEGSSGLIFIYDAGVQFGM